MSVTWVRMPTFDDEAIDYLENRRRLLLRQKTMGPVGGRRQGADGAGRRAN